MNSKCSLRLIVFLVLGGFLVGPGLAEAQTIPPTAPKSSSLPAATKKAAPKSKLEVPAQLTLEPKAMEILAAAGSRLALAHTISFTAVETFESLSRQEVPLVYANKYEVTLQRPDKLRVILAGDGPASEFYYDGKVMMAFAPAENLVAVANAPSTIDDALEAIYHEAAIYFPFTDLIVADPYGDLVPGLQQAYYVGQSKVVEDTTTDIVACADDGVFMEFWIGKEDKLPRAVHAIYLNDRDWLRHNLALSDWKIDSAIPADAFTSTHAASAKRIEFANPDPEPPPNTEPPANSTPAKKPHEPSTPPKLK